MRTPNTIEDEINKSRLRIYEETRKMTIDERVAWVNRIGEAAAKEYGFRIVASAKVE
ncbi:MAG: hypothetical protein FWF98_03030 [Dehalococcoidia bacterium]|nr:hypothetical protein [Dehalococcoidia bacterium]